MPAAGGGTQAARRVAGNDFMYWVVMCRAAALPRTVDSRAWQGQHQRLRVQAQLGLQPAPYRYSLAPGAAIPDHNPLNPKYRLFIAAWKRLPLPIANLIGPPIVRGLG